MCAPALCAHLIFEISFAHKVSVWVCMCLCVCLCIYVFKLEVCVFVYVYVCMCECVCVCVYATILVNLTTLWLYIYLMWPLLFISWISVEKVARFRISDRTTNYEMSKNGAYLSKHVCLREIFHKKVLLTR